jgi:murein L,D-transpeptidase YcbB/YkuD
MGCAKDPGRTVKLPEAITPTEHTNNAVLSIDRSVLEASLKETKDFYSNHDFKTVWTDEADRRTFLLAIKDAEMDGLQPEDYYYSKLKRYESKKGLSKKQAIAYDILMTKSFQKLANHLFKGKIAASSIYPDWALTQKKLNSTTLLTEALKDHSIDAVLNRCRPPHRVYSELKSSLKFLRELPDDTGFEKISITESIRPNDSSAVIPAVKKRLVYWNDLENNDSTLIYNKAAVKAIKRFQSRHGIYPDGIIGKSTANALNITKQQREEQVLVNLERWRWFAYDFGDNAIIINIPNYMLAMVRNDKDTIAIHKVVVGKPDRRTPVLYSKLNYLVINPTWTVPPTILTEDLTPKATEDKNYFAQHNMKIYDRDSNEVAPEEWTPELAKGYRYVQQSGNDNALGGIKFNFYNRFSVYLHDTNHREMFKRSRRALSSGCVRVDKPFDLAEIILKEEDKEWNAEKIQEIVATGETENIYLKKTNHVHQLYWTAWMDRNGLQFRNDIYNLDKALYKKLRN